jgi:hypothetical protein
MFRCATSLTLSPSAWTSAQSSGGDLADVQSRSRVHAQAQHDILRLQSAFVQAVRSVFLCRQRSHEVQTSASCQRRLPPQSGRLGWDRQPNAPDGHGDGAARRPSPRTSQGLTSKLGVKPGLTRSDD